MLIPDHETELDYLNCEAISQTVVELLKRNRRRPLTVGIHGDWGAGKSSILKMIEAQLGSDANVAVLWFGAYKEGLTMAVPQLRATVVLL